MPPPRWMTSFTSGVIKAKMKKNFIFKLLVIILGIFGLLSFAADVQAVDATPTQTKSAVSTQQTSSDLKTIAAPDISNKVKPKWADFGELFTDIPNILFIFINVGLIAAYAYGGYVYITAAGDQTREETAKKVFLFATIGLIIVYSAYVIIKQFFTLTGLGL